MFNQHMFVILLWGILMSPFTCIGLLAMSTRNNYCIIMHKQSCENVNMFNFLLQVISDILNVASRVTSKQLASKM